MIEYVAHEAHVAPMLHDARFALLVFEDPVQRRLRYSCRLRFRTGTNSPRTSASHSSPWTMGTSLLLETTTSRSRTASESYSPVHRGNVRMALRMSTRSGRRCLGPCIAKETDWLPVGVPVWRLPTRICVQDRWNSAPSSVAARWRWRAMIS
jgi:hypothetical protein